MTFRKFTILEYDTGVYQGLLNDNNQREGLGVYLCDDGTFIFGEWKNNELNGKAIIYYLNNDYIYGQFFQNQLYQDGIIYLEQQKKQYSQNDQFNEIIFETDYIKELNFLQTQYQYEIQSNLDNDVQFKYIEFNDQGFFIGICKNDTPNGLGMIMFPDSRKDYGFYKNGILHCFGKINFFNGSYYEGMIYNNVLQGAGILFHQQNWQYGIFQNDTCKKLIKEGKGNPIEIISIFYIQEYN